jgi:hypothetical protein
MQGEASDVNITLDGCTYSGLMPVQFILSKNDIMLTNDVSLNPGKVLASGE